MSLEMLAQTARMLGALLYYAPDDEQNVAILSQLRQCGQQLDWPYGQSNEVALATGLIAQGLQPDYDENLMVTWQQLFIGPDALAAPPWGSVYLDRENVLFGDSTLALRQWLYQRGIEPQFEQQEPEDHIGLMLMLVAWSAENQPDWVSDILADHLLPWAMRYLELLEHSTTHPFYIGLAKLTRLTLTDWQQSYGITVTEKDIFY
ncbi:Tat proofreading chaperone DmsD [Pectobacterium sp. B1J-3]|uniref:Tat proofreading chaperone DmsD n=1 Tax=Pectobacterium sp. B1J-3 TaxID=3385371 RepID=UPI003905EE9A